MTTNNILEPKKEEDIDNDILYFIDKFKLPNINVELKGSSQYKYNMYRLLVTS